MRIRKVADCLRKALKMTRESNPYYNPNRHVGEEISSTFEGRHVLILESNLVHVDNGDGLVDKGQPVSFGLGWAGAGVGIALKSAESASEFIPVDTEGIWRCSVTAEFPMIVGQIVFITSTGTLVDWPPDPECHIFGYTLQPIAVPGDPVTETIAVKVHWMDTGIWWWFFWYWYQEPKGEL